MSPCDYDDKYEMAQFFYEDGLREKGWLHEDEIPNMDEVRRILSEAVDAAYQTGDKETFELSIANLCHLFDVVMPSGEFVL